MAKFFNQDMEDLARQLTLSPRRLRMKQVRGIETLLGLIEPERAYPFEFVCYHITDYRKREPSTGYSIPGKALVGDLVTMAEQLTRKANIPVADIGEPYKTHDEVAEQLGVSTKTVRRWRSRGLMGIRAVYEDGVNRLAFLECTLKRFAEQNKELVSKGAAFKQLTDGERRLMVDRAAELVSKQRLKMHAAARIIAEETGRAVETVRYTLRQYDAANPDEALFVDGGRPLILDRHMAIWRCHKAGESTESIARAFDCTASDVAAIVRGVDVRRWAVESWDCVPSELFDAPNADTLILDAPEPSVEAPPTPKVPRDVPAYLRALYLTPLLTAEQERDLFRRYNYLKFKVGKMVAAIDPDEVTESQHERLAALIERVESTRQRIVRANLRLVVSIAKKHVGWSADFFEIVSDGNISLMRAVEKFDFSRGTKFSTYATWAIVKNYARSIPEHRCRYARYVTGQEELLHAAPDHREVPASQSDRQRVRELIETGLDVLTEREREVVKSHFGLTGGGGSATLEQLGQRFGVTKERIRQIEQRALSRLREVLPASLRDAIPE